MSFAIFLDATIATAIRPHIVAVVADDLGWYDTAIRNPNAPTPAIANLSAHGLQLERHYVFRFCSPSRRAFLTGRLPTSLTTIQPDNLDAKWPTNLCSDVLPLATTTIAEKLSAVGYACHFVGKGHLGYQTSDHLPVNRGFASHVGYLNGAEIYYHGCLGSGNCSADPEQGHHDLWDGLAPAVASVPLIEYSADFYTARAVELIRAHPAAGPTQAGAAPLPLFLYFAIQNVHAPFQLPPAWQTRAYPAMGAAFHTYANMLALLDESVANLTRALRTSRLWDTTLLLFTADNGGTLQFGNNHPLRGHKHDPWEGGFLPPHLHGTASHALVYVTDWYPTFAKLGGASTADTPIIAGKPRPIDGVDVWPLLTGATTVQPRPLTVITEVSAIEAEPAAGASPAKLWKLITLAGQSNRYTPSGRQIGGTMPCLAARQPDPPQPGRTDPIVNGPAHDERTRACPVCNATHPCLYDVLRDPEERTNLAQTHVHVVQRLAAAIAEANAAVYVNASLPAAVLSRYYQKLDPAHWGGFAGPCYWRR